MSSLGIALFIIALLAIILIHESGHFLTAKAFGIKVEEFFVGFGPRLWSVRRGETEYGLKALPLGGYVRIAGMNPFQEPAPEDRPRTFRAKPPWQRAIVLAAGSATHFLLALVLLALFFIFIGVPVLSRPTIAEVEPRLGDDPSPALTAGLRPGDEVLEVNGEPISTNREVIEITRDSVGEPVNLIVERDGRRVALSVTPVLSEVGGVQVGRLGVVLSQDVVGRDRSNPLVAIGRGARATGEISVRTFEVLGQVFSPSGLGRIGRLLTGEEERSVRDVTGIVGAGRLAGQAASTGNLDQLLLFLAALNIFIGILNILPLPPLDGGHLAVLAWERVSGRAVDARKLLPLTAAVAGLFILLTLSLTYLDVVSPIPNPFR